MESIKNFIQSNWLKLSVAISKFSAKIHMPYSRKKITGKHYYSAIQYLEPGIVMATRTDGELSNLGIPGFWSHIAIVTSNGSVIEATTHGVVETDLVSFFMNKDHIIALKPRFATREQRNKAVNLCLQQIGKPYDFEFASSDIKAFYCSELVTWAYNQACPDFPFKTRSVLGRDTVIPSDFPDAKAKWMPVWASNSSVVHK